MEAAEEGKVGKYVQEACYRVRLRKCLWCGIGNFDTIVIGIKSRTLVDFVLDCQDQGIQLRCVQQSETWRLFSNHECQFEKRYKAKLGQFILPQDNFQWYVKFGISINVTYSLIGGR